MPTTRSSGGWTLFESGNGLSDTIRQGVEQPVRKASRTNAFDGFMWSGKHFLVCLLNDPCRRGVERPRDPGRHVSCSPFGPGLSELEPLKEPR